MEIACRMHCLYWDSISADEIPGLAGLWWGYLPSVAGPGTGRGSDLISSGFVAETN